MDLTISDKADRPGIISNGVVAGPIFDRLIAINLSSEPIGTLV